MNRRVALRGGAIALILVVGFVAGIYVDQAYPEYVPYFGHRSVSKIDLTEVQQAARVIQADYVDTNVNSSKLSQGSVQGLVSSLGDPYSIYFDPTQYQRLLESYQGRYTGIGIYLSFNAGSYPAITGTVPGSPAAEAGLLAGDQIVKVGDKDIKGITADQATSLIQGPSGSKVTLTISRGGQTMTFTITRAQIDVPTVRSATIGNNVLYVRIYQFGAQTSTEFSKALSGGRNGADRHEVGSQHAAPKLPLVVLVDANSASASEIVAGSLQVHGRARLVGTKTFGKGSVQQDFVLSDGSDLHLTVERWYLPNGVTIDHKGLTPDVPVTLASATDAYDVAQPSLGYAKDTQLNAALSVLAGG